MRPRAAPISRRDFEARAGSNLSRTVWHKPEVRPIEIRGRPCLVKDYRPCPWWWRETYGVFMVFRETTIYAVLAGLPGIPRYFGKIDEHAFVTERIESGEIRRAAPGSMPPDFFARLRRVVSTMHRRGVVHGDLRQRRNILIGPDGFPYIIDFASAVRLPPGSGILSLAGLTDLSAIAKLKRKFAPDLLTPEEERLLRLDRFRPFRRASLRRRERRRSVET